LLCARSGGGLDHQAEISALATMHAAAGDQGEQCRAARRSITGRGTRRVSRLAGGLLCARSGAGLDHHADPYCAHSAA